MASTMPPPKDSGLNKLPTTMSKHASDVSDLTELLQPSISAKDPMGNRYKTQYKIEPVRSSLHRLKQNQQLGALVTKKEAKKQNEKLNRFVVGDPSAMGN